VVGTATVGIATVGTAVVGTRMPFGKRALMIEGARPRIGSRAARSLPLEGGDQDADCVAIQYGNTVEVQDVLRA
jgi:hypothetical protein